jgi:stage II sporulation protein D
MMPPGKVVIGIVAWGWFLLGAAPNASARLPAQVEVKLFQAHPPTPYLEVQGPAQIIAPQRKALPAGNYRIATGSGAVQICSIKENRPGKIILMGRQLAIEGAEQQPLKVKHTAAGARRYRGVVRFSSPDHQTITARNLLDTRSYVVAVLGSETLSSWSIEALKAQAVLTQSRLARYKPGDAMDDTTQAEAYLGADHERAEARDAVNDVWGQVLAYGGMPVEPFYHSTCAGGTSDGGELFKGKRGAIPYTSAVKCEFCRPSPFWKTTASEVPQSVFARLTTKGVPRPTVTDGAGRPIFFQETGKAPSIAYNFWIAIGQTLGWDKVPGTRFSIKETPPGAVRFQSTGAGHGVGMCQWGANEQARQGRSYNQLLKYYFPLAQVRRID